MELYVKSVDLVDYEHLMDRDYFIIISVFLVPSTVHVNRYSLEFY